MLAIKKNSSSITCYVATFYNVPLLMVIATAYLFAVGNVYTLLATTTKYLSWIYLLYVTVSTKKHNPYTKCIHKYVYVMCSTEGVYLYLSWVVLDNMLTLFKKINVV